MGTLSLIFGIIAIVIAVGFGFVAFFQDISSSNFSTNVALALMIGVSGAVLIRKYDKDKKNSENS